MGSSSSLMPCVSTTGEAGGDRWGGVLMLQPPALGAREGAGCGSVGDVTGAWLASAPLWPSLWT